MRSSLLIFWWYLYRRRWAVLHDCSKVGQIMIGLDCMVVSMVFEGLPIRCCCRLWVVGDCLSLSITRRCQSPVAGKHPSPAIASRGRSLIVGVHSLLPSPALIRPLEPFVNTFPCFWHIRFIVSIFFSNTSEIYSWLTLPWSSLPKSRSTLLWGRVFWLP